MKISFLVAIRNITIRQIIECILSMTLTTLPNNWNNGQMIWPFLRHSNDADCWLEMPKPNKTQSFQFQKEEEKPLSFKEKWLPKIKYYSYVLFVVCVWLFIVGSLYWTLDQARQNIKLVEDVPWLFNIL